MVECFLQQVDNAEISPLLMLPNFSPGGQEVLRLTATEAIRMHHDTISSIHLWLALIHPNSPFTRNLQIYGAGIAEITKARANLEAMTEHGVALPPKQFHLGSNFKSILVRAYEIAQEDTTQKDMSQDINEITPDHLFKAAAKQEWYISQLFLVDVILIHLERTKYKVNMEAYEYFQELLGQDDPGMVYINGIVSKAKAASRTEDQKDDAKS